MNNTKRTCKQMTGIGLAVLLLLVQCISGCGILSVGAAEDSAFQPYRVLPEQALSRPAVPERGSLQAKDTASARF